MGRFLKQWFGATGTPRAARRLGLEALEAREVPAVLVNAVSTSTGIELRITGTDQADQAEVRENSSGALVVRTITAGGPTAEFRLGAADASGVTRIVFAGKAGDDTFANFTGIPCVAHGGDGNDWLVGGRSDDTLYGGAGTDTLVGRGGTDTLVDGEYDYQDQGPTPDFLPPSPTGSTDLVVISDSTLGDNTQIDPTK